MGRLTSCVSLCLIPILIPYNNISTFTFPYTFTFTFTFSYTWSGGCLRLVHKDGSAHLLCQFMQHSGSAGHTLQGPPVSTRAPPSLTTSSLSGYMVQPVPPPRSLDSKVGQGHRVTPKHKVLQMTERGCHNKIKVSDPPLAPLGQNIKSTCNLFSQPPWFSSSQS